MDLLRHLDRAFLNHPAGADRITVTAKVEYQGTYNRNAKRPFRGDGLDLSAVQAAVEAARDAGRAARDARPYASYTAKSWHAQLVQLTSTRAGNEALAAAGARPSSIRRWLSDEENRLTRASRARISEAYHGLANRPVTRARGAYASAANRVANTLSAAIADRYGNDVRFFDIDHIELP
jgi:hypothetical protein